LHVAQTTIVKGSKVIIFPAVGVVDNLIAASTAVVKYLIMILMIKK